jgi:DNA-binding transcriptional MocR family regulator
MLHALHDHFSHDAQWTRPEGGMFLWLALPESVDAAELLGAAIERQVAFVPGHAFHADGSGHNTLRLNFSNPAPDRIREGVRRLRQAFDALPHTAHQGGPALAGATPHGGAQRATGAG